MSLPPNRVRSYLCGALAGGFTAVALVGRRERAVCSVFAGATALLCGYLCVAFEEAAQRHAVRGER